jgi:hypothetical protein
MGLRIRKSIKLGKGVRLNLNKNSVGLSVGGKLGRVSVNSKGRTTTTIHTPIKGVSYVSSHSSNPNSSVKNSTLTEPRKKVKTGKNMLIITILFGWLGVHRFMSGQIGMGILYFCTFGLFTIGWIYDIVHQITHLHDEVTV